VYSAWTDVSLRVAVATQSAVLPRETRLRELAKPRVAESSVRPRNFISSVYVDVSRVSRRVGRVICERKRGEDGIEIAGFVDLRLHDLAGGEYREFRVRAITSEVVILEHDWGWLECVPELPGMQR
tara:strand:- start:964 stop:1341 length:378 start_codon:yes stop_codon:yes gene_type:complete